MTFDIQVRIVPDGMAAAGDILMRYCTVSENVAVWVDDPAVPVTWIE